jgi:uncharacterized protein YebE (UPF0316 family)
MNIEELKSLFNSDLSDEIKKSEIINSLARDENVIPIVMRILESERRQKKELLDNMNLLLSKAHVGLEDPKFNDGGFIQKQIVEFYIKYKNKIGHCFKKIF